MPSIKNIDKFVQLLNTLGDEPRILQERGQALEPAVVPEKVPVEENPFLVNIEDDTAADVESSDIDDFDGDMPNLLGDLEALDDDTNISGEEPVGDDLFAMDDFELEDAAAPDLEIDDSFDLDSSMESLSDSIPESEDFDELDDIVNTSDEDIDTPELTDSDDIETLDSIDDFDNVDTPVDDLEDLDLPDDNLDSPDIEDESLESFDDLDILEEIGDLGDEDLDTLDNVQTAVDNENASVDDLEELDSLDNVHTPVDLPDDLSDDQMALFGDDSVHTSELDSDLSEEFDGISVEEMEPVDDLEELTDLDLDTASDSLDLDSDIPDGFGDLSIEDEVLEDDFGSLDDDDSDEFSLGDFGDSFNFDKETASTSLSLDDLAEEANEEPEVEELKFTPEEFEAIQKTMAGLPLNLKIVIEEEIAENGLFGVKLEGLVDLLIDDAPLKDIVKYVNKKLGHSIKVSSSFQKITALDFEKQKERFFYIFINSVLPKLRWIFPVGIAASLLYLAGYFWGYKIIKSENIYKRGHELILVDRYEEAYDEFLKAFNVHRKMKWYHIYADTYRDRKAYPYAEKIYLQIINEDMGSREAILNYAQMKGFEETEYDKATYFLNSYIERGVTNYSILSTMGDLYMKWAETDPKYYEDARLWYAETMNIYGPKPPILFKYLDYFIETDNLQEVKNYRRMFEISEDVEVDGDVYARMAGYLMDKGEVGNIMETIFRGLGDNPRNPNLHYQLARYFESTGDYREVEKAARNAIFYYEYGGYLEGDELESLVDAKHILGNLYVSEERYLAAEKNYKEAVSLYENLRSRSYVEKDEKFGKIYAAYGDIFYYAGNSYSSAYKLYNKAEDNLFSEPELSYKKGFIGYVEDDMESALSEFHDAESLVGQNESLLFAKANTLSHRGSYNSALTYYYIFLNYLERQEEDEETLYPAENDSHLAIVENYIKVYNNIGVTLYKLEGESALAEVGLMFTQSTEKFDYLTRDPELLIRSGLKDLAYYNTRAILYPDMDIELLLYNTIPRDFDDLNLGIVTELK